MVFQCLLQRNPHGSPARRQLPCCQEGKAAAESGWAPALLSAVGHNWWSGLPDWGPYPVIPSWCGDDVGFFKPCLLFCIFYDFCEGVDHCSKFLFVDLKVTFLQALTQRLELAVTELKGRQGSARWHFKHFCWFSKYTRISWTHMNSTMKPSARSFSFS